VAVNAFKNNKDKISLALRYKSNKFN
jgi:hypothetical protein